MSVKKINHRGKVVYYADYRGLKTSEEQIQTLEELILMTRTSAGDDLILSNYEGISIASEYMNRIKKAGKENQSRMKRQAVIGISGMKTILLDGYILFTGAKDLKIFNTEAEALDWLVS